MKKLGYYLVWVLIFCFLFSVLLLALDKVFVLFSTPEVISVFPKIGSQDVLLGSAVIIKFDKPIKRQGIEHLISPQTHGEWRFKDSLIENHLFKTLVFVPAIEFEPETQYQVEIKNIKGFGLNKASSFQFSFQTKSKENQPEIEVGAGDGVKPKITILDIPLDWQDYTLSCEAASLKMALVGKGVLVSENEIMEEINYDETEHRGNIWGDPYQKYVGDINGKICKTGYGVYWEPVAKAARNWREAEAFSEWKIEDLTREVETGNPIIVWGVLPTGNLTDCSWYTLEGKYIPAFNETHVRLVIGFIGPADNPSKIIINDPLAGRLYWLTNYFLENWKVFNNSGVVVR